MHERENGHSNERMMRKEVHPRVLFYSLFVFYISKKNEQYLYGGEAEKTRVCPHNRVK